MYSNGLNLNATSYQSVYASTGQSLTVPVSPSSLLYAHFENVQGTPAGAGEKPVSVNKLRILNTLIDQLKEMKKSPLSKEDAQLLSEKDQDTLILKYHQQVSAELKKSPYSSAGLLPEKGAIFSIDL